MNLARRPSGRSLAGVEVIAPAGINFPAPFHDQVDGADPPILLQDRTPATFRRPAALVESGMPFSLGWPTGMNVGLIYVHQRLGQPQWPAGIWLLVLYRLNDQRCVVDHELARGYLWMLQIAVVWGWSAEWVSRWVKVSLRLPSHGAFSLRERRDPVHPARRLMKHDDGVHHRRNHFGGEVRPFHFELGEILPNKNHRLLGDDEIPKRC